MPKLNIYGFAQKQHHFLANKFT